MVLRPLRTLATPEPAAYVNDAWLEEIEASLADPKCDRYRLCREHLRRIYYPGVEDVDTLIEDPSTPAATRAALLALDASHVTLEPEYYGEIDPDRYVAVKPLLWLWQSFDRSPLGGGNVALGVQLRRILARYIFRRCGTNFKCFQFVEFSFGYLMEVGDDVVIHRHVLLDDRGGIQLGNGVSVADYANIYSHSHSIVDQQDVTDSKTVLDDGVRITYHATVLAGVHVGREAMVGAGAVATKDVQPYHVALGVPARTVKVKPNAPPSTTQKSPRARRFVVTGWLLAASAAVVIAWAAYLIATVRTRRAAATELTRTRHELAQCINELFSLQELSYLRPNQLRR